MLDSTVSNIYPTTFLTTWNKMVDLTDYVNGKCFLHMYKHRNVVSNKVRIHSVWLFWEYALAYFNL